MGMDELILSKVKEIYREEMIEEVRKEVTDKVREEMIKEMTEEVREELAHEIIKKQQEKQVFRLFQKGFSVEQTADLLDLEVEFVQQLYLIFQKD